MSELDWRALLERASALRRAGRTDKAILAYRQLLAVNPDLPDSWYNLGWLARQEGRFAESLLAYQEALARNVDGPEEVHLNRAVILADHLNRPDEAEAELLQALRIRPDYVPALLNIGNLHEDLGRRDEARADYARALEAEPSNRLALARLAGVSRAESADDPMVERLEAALRDPAAGAADRADLGFALGRLLDGAGCYGRAFDAYARANAAARTSFGPDFSGYDRAAQEDLVDRLIAAFPAPPGRTGPGDSPVFICGLFRSGSTLAEQILSAHPQVRAGGELDLLPGLIRRRLQPYPETVPELDDAALEELRQAYLGGLSERGLEGGLVTDKRPDNFLHLGLVKTLFPEARIVHTRRDALDTGVSLYFLHLDPSMAYALDLGDIAHWYRQYHRLMTHWKQLYGADIFDLDYEELVERPRETIAALLDFCGLEWDETCLDFHKAKGAVKTASVWQVRQPLYSASVGRWRNYARQVEPLKNGLEGLGRP